MALELHPNYSLQQGSILQSPFQTTTQGFCQSVLLYIQYMYIHSTHTYMSFIHYGQNHYVQKLHYK